MRVLRKFSLAGTSDVVALLSWSADREVLKRNVVRLDSSGNVVWRAALPGKSDHDCFNSLERDGDGFIAGTYSEWAVRLDAEGNALDIRRQLVAV